MNATRQSDVVNLFACVSVCTIVGAFIGATLVSLVLPPSVGISATTSRRPHQRRELPMVCQLVRPSEFCGH